MALANAANFLGQTLHSTLAPERIVVVDQNETVNQSLGGGFEHRDTLYADDHLTGILMVRAELSANTLSLLSQAPVSELGSTANPWTRTRSNNVVLHGTTSGTLTMTVPAAVAPHTLTLPGAVGAPNTMLSDVAGSGTLSWLTLAGVGGVTGTGIAGRVTFWSGMSTLASDAGLTYASATDTLTLTQGVSGTGRYELTDGASTMRLSMAASGNVTLAALANADLIFQSDSTNRWQVRNTGQFHPALTDTYDLGLASLAVRRTFTNNLRPGTGSALVLEDSAGVAALTLATGVGAVVTMNVGLEVSDLTSGRITFATAAGRLTDSANLLFGSATGAVTLSSSDAGALGPSHLFDHDKASPAANDVVYRATYRGGDAAAADNDYARMDVAIEVATAGSEVGRIVFQVSRLGALTEALRITGGQGVVVNEGGLTTQAFRVEMDTHTHGFQIDPANQVAVFFSAAGGHGLGGGVGMMHVGNVTTAPSSSPTLGAAFYAVAGDLHTRPQSGESFNISRLTAKAWVRFNGSGTVAIDDDENVASITDHAVGQYTVNFTDNMANASYAFLGMARDTAVNVNVAGDIGVAAAAASHRIRVAANNDSATIDAEEISCAYFGDLA